MTAAYEEIWRVIGVRAQDDGLYEVHLRLEASPWFGSDVEQDKSSDEPRRRFLIVPTREEAQWFAVRIGGTAKLEMSWEDAR